MTRNLTKLAPHHLDLSDLSYLFLKWCTKTVKKQLNKQNKMKPNRYWWAGPRNGGPRAHRRGPRRGARGPTHGATQHTRPTLGSRLSSDADRGGPARQRDRQGRRRGRRRSSSPGASPAKARVSTCSPHPSGPRGALSRSY